MLDGPQMARFHAAVRGGYERWVRVPHGEWKYEERHGSVPGETVYEMYCEVTGKNAFWGGVLTLYKPDGAEEHERRLKEFEEAMEDPRLEAGYGAT